MIHLAILAQNVSVPRFILESRSIDRTSTEGAWGRIQPQYRLEKATSGTILGGAKRFQSNTNGKSPAFLSMLKHIDF